MEYHTPRYVRHLGLTLPKTRSAWTRGLIFGKNSLRRYVNGVNRYEFQYSTSISVKSTMASVLRFRRRSGQRVAMSTRYDIIAKRGNSYV